jgi:peptide/nickel transport system substrate-binding protein
VSQLRTFLFGDIRGYTSYTRERGDEAGAALAQQFAAIVEALAPKYDGTLQELRGDEALVVFGSARRALSFALALQERVAVEKLPRPVGIGLDAGEAVPVAEGFRGGALNTAARLCAVARAGEVLASDAVIHLAGTVEGVQYGFRRLERLKGFERPVGVTEIHPSERAPGRQLARRIRWVLLGTRPRLRLGLASLASVAIGVVVLLSIVTNGATHFEPNSIALLDAKSGSRIGTIARGLHTCLFAPVGDELWACDADQPILLRVSANGRRVADQVPLPVFHGGFTVGFGSVWVGDVSAPKVYPVDIRYRTPSRPIRLPATPARSPSGLPQNATSLATTKRAVWVAYGYPKRIARIDPQTRQVTFNAPLPQECPCDTLLAAGEGALWAVAADGLHLFRLDPATGRTLATGRLHEGRVSGVAVANGYLWVAVSDLGAVWKVDPSGAPVDKVATGAGAASIDAAGGFLWVANADAGTVTRIDPASGKTRNYRVGHRPLQVAEIHGTLFVGLAESASEAAERVKSGKVLRALVPGTSSLHVDPAFATDEAAMAISYAAGAGLMSARTTRTGATRIVPELAAGAPAISDSGRNYTFAIRDDARFSPPSNEPVTAEAIRYTIQRALSPKLVDHGCRDNVLNDLVGEGAFKSGRADRIAGLTVAGNRLTISLVRPSLTLPARLAAPCLSVVPIGTPVIPIPLGHPVPSAGPYYVDSVVPGQQLVVRRNPNYGGSRPRRIDAVILRQGMAPDRAGQLVEQGRADIAADPSGPPDPTFAPGGRYERAFGRPGRRALYVRPGSSETALLLFNTRRGLFSDLSLRRAVNYAIDRRALAAAVGGAPRSALIPPGVPGYSPAHPYPPRGDVARARSLARGRGGTATIAVQAGDPEFAALGRILIGGLARIGITVKVSAQADPLAAASDPRKQIDALALARSPGYSDPFASINSLLERGSLASGYPVFFDERSWVNRMQRAAATPEPERARAYAKLDMSLVRDAAPVAVGFGSPGVPQLFSRRVGCQTFLPEFAGWVDFSALCLR